MSTEDLHQMWRIAAWKLGFTICKEVLFPPLGPGLTLVFLRVSSGDRPLHPRCSQRPAVESGPAPRLGISRQSFLKCARGLIWEIFPKLGGAFSEIWQVWSHPALQKALEWGPCIMSARATCHVTTARAKRFRFERGEVEGPSTKA